MNKILNNFYLHIKVLASTCLLVGDKIFQIEFFLNILYGINPLAVGLSFQYFFPKLAKYAIYLLKWILAPCTIIGYISSVIMLNWDLFLYRFIPINVSFISKENFQFEKSIH